MDLSIIVVSYNTCDLTLKCLESIFQHTRNLEFEVIVIDNASTDGSPQAIAKMFPDVNIIALIENIGFGPANNFATKFAKGAYFLLLNPDTELLDNAIEKQLNFAKSNQEYAIFGGRTLFPDHTLNYSSCWGQPSLWSMLCRAIGLSAIFRHSRYFDPESLGPWKRDSVLEVPIVSGCFLFINRRAWESLGGFDEQFKMYAEEFDLCLRAKKIGLKLVHNPDAVIIHLGGASDRIVEHQTVRQFKGRSLLLAKHYSKWKAITCTRLLDLWAINKLFRLQLLSFINPKKFKESADTWGRIWARRSEWHVPL